MILNLDGVHWLLYSVYNNLYLYCIDLFINFVDDIEINFKIIFMLLCIIVNYVHSLLSGVTSPHGAPWLQWRPLLRWRPSPSKSFKIINLWAKLVYLIKNYLKYCQFRGFSRKNTTVT